MATNKYISKIKQGTDTLYIKDEEARLSIENLQTSVTGAMHYIGTTTTALTDGATTTTVTIDDTSVTPSAGDVVIYNNMEYVWNGSKWNEFGSTGSLKALAFKDNATGSVTAAGNNASSTVSLTGGLTSKLVTTTITPTNGTEEVSKVSSTNKKLGITTIKGVSGTETVSHISSTGTKSLATTTVHDTPTLNTAKVGSASNWSAGTMFAASYSEADEALTLTAGSVPSLTVTLTDVGTGLKAGTAVTVATGSLKDGSDIITSVTHSNKTVATANESTTTVATGSLVDNGDGAQVVSSVSVTNVDVAKVGTVVTVATGSVDNTGKGAEVATALHTGGTAAAQTFTGSSVSVTVK